MIEQIGQYLAQGRGTHGGGGNFAIGFFNTGTLRGKTFGPALPLQHIANAHNRPALLGGNRPAGKKMGVNVVDELARIKPRTSIR